MDEESGAGGEELVAGDDPVAAADQCQEETDGDEDIGAEAECAELCPPRKLKSRHRFAPFGDTAKFADFRKKHKLDPSRLIFIGLSCIGLRL